VEVSVGNRYPLRCVGDVDESVVVVLAMIQVGVKLAWKMLAVDFIGFGVTNQWSIHTLVDA
jgi:hypothetical protein